MTINSDEKQSLIAAYRAHEKDTGSPEVQIAILSTRISGLTEHFKVHRKDNGSRRGLLKLIAKRRKLLDYLRSGDRSRYSSVIARLGLRR